MNKFIAQNFGFRLDDVLKKRNSLKYYNDFKNTINFSRDQIENYQITKLKKLITHAYENVIFYRKRFDSNGFSPDDIKTLDDFSKIPSLKRDDLQNNWQELIANNFNVSRLSKGSSSGSTGIPVIYFKDTQGASAGKAAHHIGWELSGWEFGLKGLHIWGNPTTVNNEWKRLSSKLKVRVFNHYKYPSYKLTESGRFDELITYINKEQFCFIDGYTNAIYLLASYIKENGIRVHKPKFVFPTGENLQFFQRNLINKVLGDTYDGYGCSEINGIAYECKLCGKYHIIDPHVVVEYGKEISEGGVRKLIITDLDNWGFPLIRYENGDAAVPIFEDEINCEVKFRRIDKIEGRVSDIIKLPNGGVLSVPSFFGSMLLKQLNSIKQYQIERLREDLLIIKIVPNKSFNRDDLKIIEKSMKEYLNDTINWEIQIAEKINVGTTGKFKLLIDRTK